MQTLVGECIFVYRYCILQTFQMCLLLKFDHYVLGFTASVNEIHLKRKLLHLYIKCRHSQEAEDSNDFMEDEETSEVCNIQTHSLGHHPVYITCLLRYLYIQLQGKAINGIGWLALRTSGSTAHTFPHSLCTVHFYIPYQGGQ